MAFRTPLVATASLALLAGLTACSGHAASTAGPAPAPGSPPEVPEARADVPRDGASSLSPSSLASAVAANNAFAVDLYSRLRAVPGASTSNMLTSPLSASLALTMTYAGAVGTTASQMATALHFGSAAGSAIFDGQNALDQALASRPGAAMAIASQNAKEGGGAAPEATDYQLEIVNSLWGEKSYSWQAPFLDIMARSYGTGVYQEDFAGDPQGARTTINDWVGSTTDGKIEDLLPASAIDDLTRMVLVNAIHLKLPWFSAFSASETTPAAFTTAAAASVTTPFMHQIITTGYTDDGQAQIVELPLAGSQLAVLIALPHGDLGTYEAALTSGSAALARPTGQAVVTLSLPKVSFTSPTFSLATALQAMGMTQAFDSETANFTGLCANPPDHLHLYVSDVLQKAMIAMEETGVEAAAATAVVVSGASIAGGGPQAVTMTMNRPYLVSIVDEPTGAVMFLGHVEDPTQTGE